MICISLVLRRGSWTFWWLRDSDDGPGSCLALEAGDRLYPGTKMLGEVFEPVTVKGVDGSGAGIGCW